MATITPTEPDHTQTKPQDCTCLFPRVILRSNVHGHDPSCPYLKRFNAGSVTPVTKAVVSLTQAQLLALLGWPAGTTISASTWNNGVLNLTVSEPSLKSVADGSAPPAAAPNVGGGTAPKFTGWGQ